MTNGAVHRRFHGHGSRADLGQPGDPAAHWPGPAGETARLGFLICFPLPTRIRYDIRRSVHERGAEPPRDAAVDANREPSMKSKKPTSPRARRSPASSSGRTLDEGRAVVLDFVQSRIEAFNAEQGGGVAVRKDAHGYTLLHQDSGMPIARCAPGTPATGSRCFTGAPSANAGFPSARWEGWSSPSSMRRVRRQRPDGLLLAVSGKRYE